MGQHISLREARELTPAPTGAATEWAARMGDAYRAAITPDDLTEIMAAQVAAAKKGDAKAARFVMDVVGRAEQAAAGPKPQVVVGVRGQAEPARNGHPPRVVCDVADPDQVRRDVAVVLGRDGPLAAADLARRAGYGPLETERALEAADTTQDQVGPWFERVATGLWRLTSIGRKELLAERRGVLERNGAH